MNTSADQPARNAASMFFITAGAASLAVLLIATPILIAILSGADHPNPVFCVAIPIYLSGFLLGILSTIGLWKLRRYHIIWMPLVGMTGCGGLCVLAFCFWVISGIRVIC